MISRWTPGQAPLARLIRTTRCRLSPTMRPSRLDGVRGIATVGVVLRLRPRRGAASEAGLAQRRPQCLACPRPGVEPGRFRGAALRIARRAADTRGPPYHSGRAGAEPARGDAGGAPRRSGARRGAPQGRSVGGAARAHMHPVRPARSAGRSPGSAARPHRHTGVNRRHRTGGGRPSRRPPSSAAPRRAPTTGWR
jgi:hypothetical protein